MKKILLIGDSWIDYIPDQFCQDNNLEQVCVFGGTCYEIAEHLQVELMNNQNTYSKIILVIGRNCNCYNEKDFQFVSLPFKVIRNDSVPFKLLNTDLVHPNIKGVEWLMDQIKKNL